MLPRSIACSLGWASLWSSETRFLTRRGNPLSMVARKEVAACGRSGWRRLRLNQGVRCTAPFRRFILTSRSTVRGRASCRSPLAARRRCSKCLTRFCSISTAEEIRSRLRWRPQHSSVSLNRPPSRGRWPIEGDGSVSTREIAVVDAATENNERPLRGPGGGDSSENGWSASATSWSSRAARRTLCELSRYPLWDRRQERRSVLFDPVRTHLARPTRRQCVNRRLTTNYSVGSGLTCATHSHPSCGS